jgi:hypothetical protein
MSKKILRSISKVDEVLMRLMTYNWRYRRLEDRPQTKLAVLATILASGVTFLALNSSFIFWRIMCIVGWLSAFYEWRLWYRLNVGVKNEK